MEASVSTIQEHLEDYFSTDESDASNSDASSVVSDDELPSSSDSAELLSDDEDEDETEQLCSAQCKKRI